MALGTRPFTPGLHDLGHDNWAWLQPDGGWGWSNAGLIVDGDDALLVDTPFDLPLTRHMLDAFSSALPRITISTLVNTHSNGDHCNGNELVAAEEMAHESPETMVALLAAAPDMGVTGEFFTHCFGSFAFDGIDRPPPAATSWYTFPTAPPSTPATSCSSRDTRSSGREASPTCCVPST